MKRLIDLESYNRKEQYNFFKDFEEPFFGVTTEINCEEAYQHCKEHQIPFFSYYLFQTNRAVNQVENFRQRILDNQLIEFDTINVSTTMARQDNTFGFSFIEHSNDFESFNSSFLAEKERIGKSRTLMPPTMTEQVVHYSALPWVNFSSLSHARKLSGNDSCPKISFGKIYKSEGEFRMSVSIHAHHALVDGYHVGQLVQEIQNNLKSID